MSKNYRQFLYFFLKEIATLNLKINDLNVKCDSLEFENKILHCKKESLAEKSNHLLSTIEESSKSKIMMQNLCVKPLLKSF